MRTDDSGADLYTDHRFQIENGQATEIVQTTRIGIPNAGEATAYPWRFYERESNGVSKK
ncbi:DNA-3-methyladenine glycosylase [Exiguobacterium artemiae]